MGYGESPLTAKIAKALRKVRKEYIITVLSLRALRNPLRTLRLKGLLRHLFYFLHFVLPIYYIGLEYV